VQAFLVAVEFGRRASAEGLWPGHCSTPPEVLNSKSFGNPLEPKDLGWRAAAAQRATVARNQHALIEALINLSILDVLMYLYTIDVLTNLSLLICVL